MVTVHDVAAFVLATRGKMTTMKLHELVYYGQAWSLVWDGAPLFNEKLQAYPHGPMAWDLFLQHEGRRAVAKLPLGDAAALSALQADTLRAVVGFYGQFDGDTLSDLTHREKPWRVARARFEAHPAGGGTITHSELRAFYGTASEATRGKKFPAPVRRGVALVATLPDGFFDGPFHFEKTTAAEVARWLETGER